MPAYVLKIIQLFTDIPYNSTISRNEERELFSVVQSMAGNFLVYRSPLWDGHLTTNDPTSGHPPHYEQSELQNVTPVKLI